MAERAVAVKDIMFSNNKERSIAVAGTISLPAEMTFSIGKAGVKAISVVYDQV